MWQAFSVPVSSNHIYHFKRDPNPGEYLIFIRIGLPRSDAPWRRVYLGFISRLASPSASPDSQWTGVGVIENRPAVNLPLLMDVTTARVSPGSGSEPSSVEARRVAVPPPPPSPPPP